MVSTLQGEIALPTLSQVLPPLDDTSAQPLYQQLQRALRGAIENRVIGPDDALPPERDLAEMLNVSRITVRKAIDELVEDGLLIRKQGSGTFVSNRVEKNFAKLTSFSEDMRARGREPRSVWMNRAAGTVTPGGVADPALQPRHAGVSLSPHPLRRRRADGPRIRHRDRLLPALARSGGDLAVRGAGDAPAIARCAPCSACARCCSPPSRPNYSRRRRAMPDCWWRASGYLKDGRAVEFSQSYYRGDIYDFVAELNASS